MFYHSKRKRKEEYNIELWLKFEFIEFCKENNLSTQGNKLELKERIKKFLVANEKKLLWTDIKSGRKIKNLER